MYLIQKISSSLNKSTIYHCKLNTFYYLGQNVLKVLSFLKTSFKNYKGYFLVTGLAGFEFG